MQWLWTKETDLEMAIVHGVSPVGLIFYLFTHAHILLSKYTERLR